MPLTPYAKELIKSPYFAGHYSQIAPRVRRLAGPNDYNLTKVKNTWITCTHCQGNKIQYGVSALAPGLMTKEACGICEGRGVIFR